MPFNSFDMNLREKDNMNNSLSYDTEHHIVSVVKHQNDDEETFIIFYLKSGLVSKIILKHIDFYNTINLNCFSRLAFLYNCLFDRYRILIEITLTVGCTQVYTSLQYNLSHNMKSCFFYYLLVPKKACFTSLFYNARNQSA